MNSSLKIWAAVEENKQDCVGGDGSLDLKQTPEFTIKVMIVFMYYKYKSYV